MACAAVYVGLSIVSTVIGSKDSRVDIAANHVGPNSALCTFYPVCNMHLLTEYNN